MKKINFKYSFILLIVVFFCSSCEDNDSNFYNVQYVAANGLITIETLPSYTTTNPSNNVIYLSGTFSRFLPEANQSTLLDIYQTTNSPKFNFSYILEKKIDATNWEIINNPLVIDKGTAITGSYILGTCLYNSTTQNYEYRVGIRLLTAGNYRMSFGYNSDFVNTVELRSESLQGNIFLNINSSIPTLDAGGFYNFTVN